MPWRHSRSSVTVSEYSRVACWYFGEKRGLFFACHLSKTLQAERLCATVRSRIVHLLKMLPAKTFNELSYQTWWDTKTSHIGGVTRRWKKAVGCHLFLWRLWRGKRCAPSWNVSSIQYGRLSSPLCTWGAPHATGNLGPCDSDFGCHWVPQGLQFKLDFLRALGFRLPVFVS